MNDETLPQQTQTWLAQLTQHERKLKGVLLASADGLLVAHHLRTSDQLEKIAAMSTALHALGQEVGVTLQLGGARAQHIQLEQGDIYLLGAGEHTLVLVAQGTLAPAFLESCAQQALQFSLSFSPKTP